MARKLQHVTIVVSSGLPQGRTCAQWQTRCSRIACELRALVIDQLRQSCIHGMVSVNRPSGASGCSHVADNDCGMSTTGQRQLNALRGKEYRNYGNRSFGRRRQPGDITRVAVGERAKLGMRHENLKNAHNLIGWQPPLLPMPRLDCKSPRGSHRILVCEPNLAPTVAMKAGLRRRAKAADRDINITFLVSPETPRGTARPVGRSDGPAEHAASGWFTLRHGTHRRVMMMVVVCTRRDHD